MNQSSPLSSPGFWTPGPWVRGLSKVTMWAAILGVMMPAVRQLAPLTRGLEYRFAASLGLLLGLVCVAVVLHELGHYLAARRQGAAVVRATIGPVELTPQRGRWLWRWSSNSSWFSGTVVAIPRLDKPFVQQMIWFIAAGPLANFSCALVATGAGWVLADSEWSRILYAFAMISALLGAVNLLPFSAASDGAQLIRYWKGWDLGQPGMEAFELNMRAMAGHTADEAPEELLLGVERESPPMGLWFRIFAALNRQDWAGVRELGSRLDAWEALLDRPSRTALATFIGLLRFEVQFARGLQDGVGPLEVDEAMRREISRLRPGAAERHEALAHALAGRRSECDAALARAERAAEFNPDAAARKTETRLRAVVRNLVPGVPAW